MPCSGGIAQLFHLVTQAEGHGIAAGGLEGPHRPGGDQGGAGGIFPVGGGLPPQGVVEILKDEPLVGQLIKRRGVGLVDGVAPKTLAGQENQVFPRKHPGVRIGFGRLPVPEKRVHFQQKLVRLL